jgi:murein DD-endopeptidase MepM/ murein hydrolase activator NlpD
MARRRAHDSRVTEWLVAAGAGFFLGAFAMALVTVEPRARSPAARDGAERAAIADRERAEPGALPVDGPPVLSTPGDPADGEERRARLDAPAPDLASRDLRVPVRGVDPAALVSSFDDARGANRRHEAIDILAPRHTPVIAVEAGRIARLFTSAAGGLTIYQFDPAEDYVYYYAHLEAYAAGLSEGDPVRAGQVVGYVGTTGNAPADVPHLHFAIMRLTADRRWWEGTPIDPYPLLRDAGRR